MFFRKLKERIAQLDSENTALTKAHIERYTVATSCLQEISCSNLPCSGYRTVIIIIIVFYINRQEATNADLTGQVTALQEKVGRLKVQVIDFYI